MEPRRSRRRSGTEDEEEANSKGSKGGSKPNSRGASPMPEEMQRFNAIEYLQGLPPLPSQDPNVRSLTAAQTNELDKTLELDGMWPDDWSGQLALAEKDILNPAIRGNLKKSFRQPLLLWAVNSPGNVRILLNLLRQVCTLESVPSAVKKILGSADAETPVEDIIRNIRRASYDPQVLKEDGWTTEKTTLPLGATGGPYLIGDSIRCDSSDAVVIAYVHDPDIGDLWKAIWVDDLISFDLEAEELLEGKKKWERRYNQPSSLSDVGNGSNKSRRSTRNNIVSSDFTVKGIEHGIVLAASYTKGARPGVYWPARVMHASEGGGAAGRRSISKQKVELVFLAPYWRSDDITSNRGRRAESMSDTGASIFESTPLLHVETVEASDEMIKEFPRSPKGVDIVELQMRFRFTGLPKSAFTRYLDAHRLALALQEYAKEHVDAGFSETDRASAGLFETHPMSVQAPTFPSVILHLPFDYMLAQLPRSFEGRSSLALGTQDSKKNIEPVMKLKAVIDGMKPPACWGEGRAAKTPQGSKKRRVDELSPAVWLRGSDHNEIGDLTESAISGFMSSFPTLNDAFNRHCSSAPLVGVLSSVSRLLSQMSHEEEMNQHSSLSVDEKRQKLKALVTSWAIVKRLGEESLTSLLRDNVDTVVLEWRRAMERIYKYFIGMYSDGEHLGKGLSVVITDGRCNGHRTSDGCFERPVRLPAAIKGAKLAGAGQNKATRLLTSVPDEYVDLVEEVLLARTHDATYLKRMKSRCAAARTETESLVLTDDSEGEGGEDTRGSRGTWQAAVVGVAAAVKAADMVVRGECINAFCVTRPPGHHAGRQLHPMKAVSNGFCILNAVACVALYATTPISEGGLGLGRVCVIDFDVHHGNGTQDILCSSHDPRFLYVSIHAGGAEINGHPMEDDPNHELHDLGSNPKMSGIYPGRCGDTSPNLGVLNIPLGAKVTSHAVGSALLNRVSPRVEAFSPDLILLSAGFDAHKSDPMGLGGLSAEDFGHITQVACQLAYKSCGGRILSVLEGGYGVPCCRPQQDLFLPKPDDDKKEAASTDDKKETASIDTAAAVAPDNAAAAAAAAPVAVSQETDDGAAAATIRKQRPQPSKLLELDDGLFPDDMDDQVPYALQARLEKCHAEGFVECVSEHVKSLIRCSRGK